MKDVFRLVVAAALLALAPATAHAEWFVFPFAATNAGGQTTQESGAYGGSVGWTSGGWWGAEAELAWAPDFFEDDEGFRIEHRTTTFTGTALAGRLMGAWRPYGAAGLGALRFDIEETGGLASVSETRPAFHAGGGVMWTADSRVGIRGDVRYIRALGDEEPTANVFPERFVDFDYWRIGGGIVVAW
jgi:hypothetical protein